MKIVAGIVSITIGTIVLYRTGHKQIPELDVASFIFIYFGWLAIIGSIRVIRKAKANNRKKIIKNLAKAAQIIAGIVISFAQVEFIQSLWIERVNQIISTQPTATTSATIIDVDDYQRRITIEYIVNKKAIRQHLYFSTLTDYREGQKIRVVYSVENPEMFNAFK